MPSKPRWTAQQFIAAIDKSGGIHSTIAARIGCNRMTVQVYIDRYPTVKAAYEQERKKIDDKAQSNILAAIQEGDLSISKWWATVKMPEEFAPTVKQQHSGPDGGDITIRFVWTEDDDN